MSDRITTKQGDSLSMDGLLTDASGTPIDLTSYSISSSVRAAVGSYGLGVVGGFTITKANQGTDPGRFTMTTTAGGWPTGDLLCDVKVIDGAGVVTHSSTFTIHVDQAIT